VVECGPCPVFASFTLAFALQLRKKHGKPSVRVRKTPVRLRKTSVAVQYTYYQKHPHITKPSQTHTLQNPLIHTLQTTMKAEVWVFRKLSPPFPPSTRKLRKTRVEIICYTRGAQIFRKFKSLLPYLLAPWSRVLLEKLTVNFAASQEIPRIYGTLKFLTVPTSTPTSKF
jgi:hypothetical protein